MLARHRWLLPYCCIALLWLVALTLGRHSGVVMLVDSKSGKRACVDMLAHYFNMPQYGEIFSVLGSVSIVLVFLLPVIALVLGLGRLVSARRAR